MEKTIKATIKATATSRKLPFGMGLNDRIIMTQGELNEMIATAKSEERKKFQEEMEEAKKEGARVLLEEILEEYGQWGDGCGCCQKHTLQEMLNKKYSPKSITKE